jgi:hypothetical protein
MGFGNSQWVRVATWFRRCWRNMDFHRLSHVRAQASYISTLWASICYTITKIRLTLWIAKETAWVFCILTAVVSTSSMRLQQWVHLFSSSRKLRILLASYSCHFDIVFHSVTYVNRAECRDVIPFKFLYLFVYLFFLFFFVYFYFLILLHVFFDILVCHYLLVSFQK